MFNHILPKEECSVIGSDESSWWRILGKSDIFSEKKKLSLTVWTCVVQFSNRCIKLVGDGNAIPTPESYKMEIFYSLAVSTLTLVLILICLGLWCYRRWVERNCNFIENSPHDWRERNMILIPCFVWFTCCSRNSLQRAYAVMNAPEPLEVVAEVAINVPGGACDSVRRTKWRTKK